MINFNCISNDKNIATAELKAMRNSYIELINDLEESQSNLPNGVIGLIDNKIEYINKVLSGEVDAI